jgi:cellulose synthase/poly-beta-1,6-N-acetylglucosamine synthase-like glycosyltransferase
MPVSLICVFPLMALFIVLPVLWSWRLVWLYFCRSRVPTANGNYSPQAAVILCLRGADPSLASCLTGLLQQDYPRYPVWIVVDSREDPAWNMVRQVLAGGFRSHVEVHVELLEQRRETCSLKVSSQLQIISKLDSSVEVVALIDADAVPARDWLRSLVAPLADPRIGASSGVRWFVPPDSCWGTIVRHLYNSASFTQMYAFNIPWGGSLAIRARLLQESKLVDHWSQCFCEDNSAYGILRAHGLRLAFVPEATQINRESIDLAGCFNFILRQLLCVRLHHVHWRKILLVNIGIFLVQIVCALLLGAGWIMHRWDWAIGSAALLGLYGVGMFSALAVGEVLIRRIIAKRGETLPYARVSWRMWPAGILTQLLSIYCLIASVFLRTIHWRGVAYAIHGPENIRLLEYHPFQPLSAATEPSRSVV